MEKPTYYGILPSKIRYDERLKPMERIIYTELTVLTYTKGYCFATNSYFAKLYKVHKNTVSIWLKDLEKYGYINIEYIMKDKQIEERRITLVKEERIEVCQEERKYIEERDTSRKKREVNIEEEIFFERSLVEEVDKEEIDEMENFEKNLVEKLFGENEKDLKVEGNKSIENIEEKKESIKEKRLLKS